MLALAVSSCRRTPEPEGQEYIDGHVTFRLGWSASVGAGVGDLCPGVRLDSGKPGGGSRNPSGAGEPLDEL